MRLSRNAIQLVCVLTALVVLTSGCGSNTDTNASSTDAETPSLTRTMPVDAPVDSGTSRRNDTSVGAGRWRAAANELSLAEQTGQLVMTAVPGSRLLPADRKILAGSRIGGVILFRGNVDESGTTAALAKDLDALARESNSLGAGMLLAMDQEGGEARILVNDPPVRWPAEFGPDGAATAATAAAKALERSGVQLNLAPVADLALPPVRVMSGRALSSDPDEAARGVVSWVDAAHEAGGAVTLKHFPGLGRGRFNTDEGATTITATRQTLESSDIVPFAAGIAAGADAVMLTHATVEAFDAKRPATISPTVIDYLRDDLGFEGVIVTDSLNAKGFRDPWGDTVPRACPAFIAAGGDLALLTGTPETARLCAARIRDAVKDGTIDEDQLVDSVARVLAMKESVGLVEMPADASDG